MLKGLVSRLSRVADRFWTARGNAPRLSWVPCWVCGGTGVNNQNVPTRTCAFCQGVGTVVVERETK